MDWLAALGNFLVNEILSVPAFLIGIITAVGLVALRKSAGAYFHAVDFVAEGKQITGKAIDEKGTVQDTFTVTLP